MESGVCIILTSVESKTDAMDMAGKLIGESLAACVQISAEGSSVYRWKGNIQQDQECFIQIKTTLSNKSAVIEWLEKHHPYDIPEILCLNADASRSYLEWASANTSYAERAQ
ncbi:MAG: divalent-cation tolerance protein CutA [Mariprofundaceae bacterium]